MSKAHPELVRLINNLKSAKQTNHAQPTKPSLLAETLVKDIAGGKSGGIEVFVRWDRKG